MSGIGELDSKTTLCFRIAKLGVMWSTIEQIDDAVEVEFARYDGWSIIFIGYYLRRLGNWLILRSSSALSFFVIHLSPLTSFIASLGETRPFLTQGMARLARSFSRSLRLFIRQNCGDFGLVLIGSNRAIAQGPGLVSLNERRRSDAEPTLAATRRCPRPALACAWPHRCHRALRCSSG